MAFQFQKAERRKQKLRLGITGPGGSGKTEGALALARGLVGESGKIAVLDTENGSAALYADRFDFQHGPISPPYTTAKFLEGMQAAVEAGFDLLIIDSISHQWDGEGGILQRKDLADARPGANHWTNWGPFTKEHESFRAAILYYPLHIIVTMRSKMAYQQTESGGRKKVEKLGLQPIQREGMDYELTLVFDLQMDHRATVSKERTGGLFDGRSIDLKDPETADSLKSWLEQGREPEALLIPFGQYSGQPVSALPDEDLNKLVAWCDEDKRRSRYTALLNAALDEVSQRVRRNRVAVEA